MTTRRWLHLLGIAVALGLAWIGLLLMREPDLLRVRALTLQHARSGISPPVRLDRVVREPVHVEWAVTVRDAAGDEAAIVCSQRGVSDLRPGAPAPAGADLDWLMNVPPNPPCAIAPGRYVVTAVWIVAKAAWKPQVDRIESNVFEVLP